MSTYHDGFYIVLMIFSKNAPFHSAWEKPSGLSFSTPITFPYRYPTALLTSISINDYLSRRDASAPSTTSIFHPSASQPPPTPSAWHTSYLLPLTSYLLLLPSYLFLLPL